MSLRIFHIVFIAASILLSLLGGVWGVRLYFAERSVSALATGIFFIVLGAALVFYAFRAIEKFKELA